MTDRESICTSTDTAVYGESHLGDNMSDPEALVLWIHTAHGERPSGQTHYVTARNGHFSDNGKYEFKKGNWQEHHTPGGSKEIELATALIERSETDDIFVCISTMWDAQRTPGSCTDRVVIHNDWDGDPTDTADALTLIEAAGGCAVS